VDLRYSPQKTYSSNVVWEDQTIKWQFATGWVTSEIIKSLLVSSSSLKKLAISANTLQSTNPGGSGLKPIYNQTSALQRIT